MFHSLVVCTKNRPSELLRLLKELPYMSPTFNEVIVIDSSEKGKTLNFPIKAGHSIPIFVINTEANLSQARNVGIRSINKESQIVHFVDDDTSLSSNYLLNVNIFFENNPTASAVTGLDQKLAANKSIKIRLIRFYCKMKKSSGRISRLGFNFGNYSPSSNYKIDWLPGCNMIVRRNVLQNIRFTETENITFCEDLVFGLDLTRSFDAYFCSDILYTHHLSQLNRNKNLYIRLKSAKFNLTFLSSNYPRYFNTSLIRIRLIWINLRIRMILLRNRLK
jgi:GT2 family glycosyltransferase